MNFANPNKPNKIAISIYVGCVLCVFVLALSKFYIVHFNYYHQDFVAFWSASYLTLLGRAKDVYDASIFFSIENLVEPRLDQVIVWPYPPTYFLPNALLALTDIKSAYWYAMLLTLAPFLYVFGVIIRGNSRLLWLGLLGFPPLWETLFNGHNAYLTAALAGISILYMNKRPVLAGFCIGLLIIKPHLGILFPIALVASSSWRAMFIASLTSCALIFASYYLLGADVYLAYFESMLPGNLNEFIVNVQAHHWTPTIFSMLRSFGATEAISYLLHTSVTIATASAVYYVWRETDDVNLRGAILMSATLLVSPHIGLYDLTWLTYPMAWIFIDIHQQHFVEWHLRALAWIWGLFLSLMILGVSIGFYWVAALVMLFIIFIVVRLRQRETFIST